MALSKEALFNDFVIRSFRDIADGDYIVARQSFRQQLIQQALWSGLQAIEKYLKGILALNRVSARGLGHNIQNALERVREKIKFELRLTPAAEQFIEYLDSYGKYRYYEISYHAFGREMVLLDHTVWHIRRYCAVLDYKIQDASGQNVEMLDIELRRIRQSEREPFQHFALNGGYLERIIASADHPARAGLLWQNGFYGKRIRKRVRLRTQFNAGNAPLSLHPGILDEVLKYVQLPPDAIRAYQRQAAEMQGKK